MILLDTGFLIRALVRNTPEDRKIRDWLRAGELLGMSAVGWTEFLCGPVEAREIELASRVVGDRIPFGERDAAQAADLFNNSGRRRGTLVDCMIAAAAIVAEAPLATTNPTDFRKFESAGLELLVWERTRRTLS